MPNQGKTSLTKKQQAALAAAPKGQRKELSKRFTADNKRGGQQGKGAGVAGAAPPRRARRGRPQPRRAGQRTHEFDPTSSVVPATLYPSLGVFPVNASAKEDVVMVVATRNVMVVSAIPGYATCAYLFRVAKTGTSLATTSRVFTMPTVAAAYSAGGPTSSRYTKVGFRMENATPAMYQGGKVYVTHLTQRLSLPASPSTMTADQWATVANDWRTMPVNRTQAYTWGDFGADGRFIRRPFYCTVVDEPKYHDFATHRGATATFDDFWEHIAVWNAPAASVESPHPMSVLVVHWDNIDAATTTNILQDVTIQVDAQFLTRWPVGTVLGQSLIDLKEGKSTNRPPASPTPAPSAPP